ncbi:CorA family divalent cation transporter [Loktanella agnita]|uniref:CorA family divalent cation transporter n=1 Tax=Loktanella agnita TaxID=287097 RepID=UPI003986459E
MSIDASPQAIHAFDIHSDGSAHIATDVAPHPAPGAAYRWLHFDLSDPFLTDWATQLPLAAARSLLAAKTRPRVATHDSALIVTLRGINRNAGAEAEDMVSLRLWVTSELVVSVRRVRVFAMDDLRSDIDRGHAPPTAGRLLARVCENVAGHIEAVSVDLEERADDLEEMIYDDGRLDAPELAPMHRMAIRLRRHIGPLSDALLDLTEIETPLLPQALRDRLRDNANRVRRSVEEVTEVRDRLQTLTTHLNLSNDARLGRNSYLLSVVAAIFLPLGFLTGLFGVNLAGMPGTEAPYAFALLCAGVAVLGVAVFVVLRWIKWF